MVLKEDEDMVVMQQNEASVSLPKFYDMLQEIDTVYNKYENTPSSFRKLTQRSITSNNTRNSSKKHKSNSLYDSLIKI